MLSSICNVGLCIVLHVTVCNMSSCGKSVQADAKMTQDACAAKKSMTLRMALSMVLSLS